MASALKLLAGLTPPPFVQPVEYDGLEYRWKMLVFRPGCMSFIPAFCNAFSPIASVQGRGVPPRGSLVLHYLVPDRCYQKQEESGCMARLFTEVLSTIGTDRMDRLKAHNSIYEQQFSAASKGELITDGHSDFFTFSTGRRNVESLHTIFTLRPRHDFLQWAFQTGRTFIDLDYHPVDDIQLDFKLAPGTLAYDLVWAVVAKDELRSIKHDRWDLVSTVKYVLWGTI